MHGAVSCRRRIWTCLQLDRTTLHGYLGVTAAFASLQLLLERPVRPCAGGSTCHIRGHTYNYCVGFLFEFNDANELFQENKGSTFGHSREKIRYEDPWEGWMRRVGRRRVLYSKAVTPFHAFDPRRNHTEHATGFSGRNWTLQPRGVSPG